MRTAPAKVSVVIAALDVADVIDIQLAALAGQDYNGDVEVVVADNGSADGLREHLAKHELAQPLSLRWVDASQAPGAAHARNIGAAAASGDLLVFCDADDQVAPQWLRLLAAAAVEYDAVAGGLDATMLSSPTALVWRPAGAADQPYMPNATLRWGGGGNLGVWRAVFESLGGWNTTYISMEDIEFCWRLQYAGYSLGWCPGAVAYYRYRDDIRAMRKQAYAYGRGEARLFRDFRERCMSRRRFIRTAGLIVALIVYNPLVPSRLTGVTYGYWLWNAAGLAGRIRGSIEQRVLYL